MRRHQVSGIALRHGLQLVHEHVEVGRLAEHRRQEIPSLTKLERLERHATRRPCENLVGRAQRRGSRFTAACDGQDRRAW